MFILFMHFIYGWVPVERRERLERKNVRHSGRLPSFCVYWNGLLCGTRIINRTAPQPRTVSLKPVYDAPGALSSSRDIG